MPEVSNIIVWLILGGISGWIASMIAGKDASMGIVANIIVGIIGAFIGGWVAGLLGLGPATGLNIWSFIVAIGGALILLWIIGLVKKKVKQFIKNPNTKRSLNFIVQASFLKCRYQSLRTGIFSAKARKSL